MRLLWVPLKNSFESFSRISGAKKNVMFFLLSYFVLYRLKKINQEFGIVLSPSQRWLRIILWLLGGTRITTVYIFSCNILFIVASLFFYLFNCKKINQVLKIALSASQWLLWILLREFNGAKITFFIVFFLYYFRLLYSIYPYFFNNLFSDPVYAIALEPF